MPITYTDTAPEATDSQWTLLAKQLQAIATYDGGSGGMSNSINYVGPPLATPPTIAAIVVDSAGQQWQFFAGSWH